MYNNDEKNIIIATSSYNEKYFFNEEYDALPKEVKKELIQISVEYVNDVGGTFVIRFGEDGHILLDTSYNDDDFNYDEIGSRTNIAKLQKDKKELFKALSLWYKLVYKKEIDSTN